jgi:hypothetical protein
MIPDEIIKKIAYMQKGEITEYIIYRKLSQAIGDAHNGKILMNISKDELKHYSFWNQYTNREQKPDQIKVWFYYLVSRIFGITFGIKLMEKGEEKAQLTYEEIGRSVPEAMSIVDD